MTHSDNTPTSSAVSTEQEAEPDGTVTRYQSFALLGASILAAVATLGATMIAQRSLGSEQLKEFLLFWAALFMVTGIITGIQPEVTRSVRSPGRWLCAPPPCGRLSRFLSAPRGRWALSPPGCFFMPCRP